MVSVATQPPSLVPPWVEQHAGRIPDPVERLRFLRLQASAPVSAKPRSFKRALLWVAAAIVPAIVPGPIPTGTAETFAREQHLLVPVTNQAEAVSPPASRVWRVDYAEASEIYSNGLRIDL